jgi:hypothetical protein
MMLRRVGRQAAGPCQHSRPAAQSQWFATVPSGSTTLSQQRGYAGSCSTTATRWHHYGPPVRHRYRPSNSTAPRRTTDRVPGGRQQDQACPRR